MVSGSSLTKSGGKYSRYLAIGQYLDTFWQGRAGQRLGIAGMPADESSFQALTDLRNPVTGEELKPRHKQKITMWDLTVSAPKSASLVALFDSRVAEAHSQAAALVPAEVERFSQSGNIVYNQVQHYVSRLGDPQWHTHTPIINLTFNSNSEKWECLRHNFMNYWAQYQLTETYRERYAQSLINLGYEIQDRPKQGFEIAGVQPEIIERFSQRAEMMKRIREEISYGEKIPYGERVYINRPPKMLYAETYDTYVQQQKERLTQAERISLKETVEIAQEKAYKLNLRWNVGEAEDSGPELKQWTYGHRISF